MSRLVLFVDFLVESRIRCLSYGEKEGEKEEPACSRARQVGRCERWQKARRELVPRAATRNCAKGNFDSVGEEEELKGATGIHWIMKLSGIAECRLCPWCSDGGGGI